MTSVKDEFVYHEMITHIPLFTHPNPENILVVGIQVECGLYDRFKKYDPLEVAEDRFHEIETMYYTKKLHKAAFVLSKFVQDLVK